MNPFDRSPLSTCRAPARTHLTPIRCTRKPRILSGRIAVAALAATGLFAFSISAEAVSGTWTGGTNNWSNAGSWTGAVADGADFTADFSSITAAATVTLDTAARTIGNLTFSNAMTLASGANVLTLQTTTGTPTLAMGANNITISAILAGNQGFTKTGAGALTLQTGANTWTGNATVNAGTLSVNIGQSSTAGFVLNNGVTMTTNQALTSTNVITARSGTSTLTGSGTTVNYVLAGNGNVNLNLSGSPTTVSTTLFSNFGGTASWGSNNFSIRLAANSSGTTTVADPFATLDLGSGTGNVFARGGGGNDIIVLGAVAASGSGTALGGNSTAGANTTTYFVGSANTDTSFAGRITAGNTSAITAFTKVGAGTMTLTGAGGAYTNTGAYNFNGGTVKVDYAATPTGVLAGTATGFGGGTLYLLGKNTSATIQTLGNVTVNFGGGRLVVDPNGGTSTTLTLGTLTATVAGGTLNIQSPDVTLGTGTAAITTTSTHTTFGTSAATSIYTPRITYSGDWAQGGTTGTPTLSAYSSYNDLTTSITGGGAASTTNDRLNNVGSATISGGAFTTNTLKITNSSTQSLDLGGNTLGLTTGGLLFSGSAAYSIGTAIDNGTLKSAAGNDLIVQQLGTGNFTINSMIANGAGTSSLTKGGFGTLTLTGTNTYTGITTINGGAVSIGRNANLGAVGTGAQINLNGGTLQATASFGLFNGSAGSNNRAVVLGGGGGTIEVTNSNNLAVAGVVSTLTANQFGPLIKTGTGTLTLSGTNTYGGATIIRGGTLSTGLLANGGIASGIGTSANVAPALVLDGGTLQYTGGVASSDRTFTVTQNGGALDASGSAALTFANTAPVVYSGSGARTLTLTGVNTGANTLAAAIGDGTGGATTLAKTSAGTWVLTGANTHTGGTTVGAGTLQVGTGNTSALGAGALTMNSGTLDLNSVNTTVGVLSGSGGVVTSSSGSATLTTNHSAGATNSFAGAIQNGASGTVGFSTLGTDTTILTGTNNYSGATSVGGSTTLAISATGSLGDTAVTVGNGATFSARPGSGNITLGTTGASLNLNAGASFNMTDSAIGTLTLNSVGAGVGSMLTLGGTTATPTSLTFEVGGTGADQLIVNNGTVSFAGTPRDNITLSVVGSTAPVTLTGITLLSVPNGTLTLANFSLQTTAVTFGSNSYVASLSLNAGNTQLLLNLAAASLNYYWTGGGANTSWITVLNNFATDAAGASSQTATLGAANNVFLTANSASHFSQTLDASTVVNSLSFAGTSTSAASNAVTLASGTGTNTLTINAANAFTDSASNPYAAGIGLVVQSGSAAHTISVDVVLGASQKWEIDNAVGNALTVNGNITDGGSNFSLTKVGTGGLILGGTNTYGGLTTVTNGMLTAASDAALGSSTAATAGLLLNPASGTAVVNFTSATPAIASLASSGGGTSSVVLGNTTAPAATTLTVGGNNATTAFSGVISDGTGTNAAAIGSLTKTGTGTLTLSGANTYQGLTTVSSGAITAANNSALGSSTASTSGLLLNPSSGTATVNFTSTTPAVGSLANLGGGTSSVVLGNTTTPAATTLTLGGNGASTIFNGIISDGTGTNAAAIGNLTKTGAGTFTLGSANTFTGQMVVNGGTLTLGTALALQNSTLNYNNQGGTLSFGTLTAATFGGLSGFQNLALTNALSGNVALTVGNNNVSSTYGGTLSGGGSLIKNGTGTITIGSGASGGATYTGATTINTGTLQLGGVGVMNSGATAINVVGNAGAANLIVADAAQVTTTGTLTLTTNAGNAGNPNAATLTVKNNAQLTVGSFRFGDNAGRVPNGTFVTVQDSAAFTVSGTLDLNNTNSGTGVASNNAVNLNGGTTTMKAFVDSQGNSTTHLSTINFNGGILRPNQSDDGGSTYFFLPNFANSAPTPKGLTARVLAGGAKVDTGGFDITVAQPLTSGIANDGGLVKSGLGTLTFTGTNSYLGTTIVNAGTLAIAGGTTGTAGADIQIAPGNGLTAALTVATGSTVNALRVIVAGNSTNTVTGNPVGSVTQTAGTINSAQWFTVGSGNAGASTSASGTFTMSGGILNVNSSGFTQMEVGDFAGTSGAVTVSGSSAINIYNSGNIALGANDNAASGTFTQNGGTVTFYSDAGTTVGGTGQLKLGAAANSSGTFTYNLNGGMLTVPSITHTAGVGTFNLNGGTLKATGTSGTFMTGLTAANVQAGGAIIDDGGFAITMGQNLIHDPALGATADGGLTKSGNGTLTLTGINTYTGPTSLNGGTLAISGSINGTSSVNVVSGGALLISGASEAITNSAPLSLNTGTTVAFGTGLSSRTETLDSLTLLGNAILDFGDGSTNKFAFTNGISGLGSFTLSIYNWSGPVGDGTQDVLALSNALNPTELSHVSFYSDGAGLNFLGTGSEIAFGGPAFAIVPVPEPSSTAMIGSAGLLGLFGYRKRRRMARR